MHPKISVGVFDDHPVILNAVVSSLKENGELLEVLFATSAKQTLLEFDKGPKPDVLILDIISQEVTALELFEHFRREHPEIAVIAYSTLTSPILVENLLYFGIRGFVNKRQPLSDLIRTVILAAEGKVTLPEDYHYLASSYKSDNTAILTNREIEIVRLISNESTSSEIATILGLSDNTIENHRKRIFLKLNVKNVAGMVLEATKLGYIH